jgi:hypothetical protein
MLKVPKSLDPNQEPIPPCTSFRSANLGLIRFSDFHLNDAQDICKMIYPVSIIFTARSQLLLMPCLVIQRYQKHDKIYLSHNKSL